MRMPPIAVELLMRCRSRSRPNGPDSCTEAHARSPAMCEWLRRFRDAGILQPDVTIENLIQGKILLQYLTPAGEELADRVCEAQWLPTKLSSQEASEQTGQKPDCLQVFRPSGMGALTHQRLIDAALALCRMRGVSPGKKVSETKKRTWLQQHYSDLYSDMQVHVALRDQGLIDG